MSSPFFLRLSLAASVLLLTSACASRPPASDPDALAAYREANDRFEPFNRAMFRTDIALDRFLVRPVVKGYRAVVPAPGRRGVTNFVQNIRAPITFVHDVLQAEPSRAATTFGRFVINSTIGIAGLFDVAEDMGLPYHSEDLGQTLAVWGVGDGPYVYVPLLGPSTLRDSIGFGADAMLVDPIAWYSRGNGAEQWVQWTVFGLLAVSTKDETMDALDELKASSLDYYAALRSAYRQVRANEIRNGALPPMDDFDDPAEPAQASLNTSPDPPPPAPVPRRQFLAPEHRHD